MPTERVQRQIDRLLDEAEAAVVARDWAKVREAANDALTLNPQDSEAAALFVAAARGLVGPSRPAPTSASTPSAADQAAQPTSFDGNGPMTVHLQTYKGGYADPSALELNERLASAEAARRSAMVRRWTANGLSKATSQHIVLCILHFAEANRMTQAEVGRRLCVTSSNVTRLIDGLEADGLVQRSAENAGRRVSYVELTSAGSDLAQRLVPIVVQFSIDVAAVFSDDEVQTFLSLLSRLEAHTDSILERSRRGVGRR